MPESRVLVVGTTPDYVALIRERFPERALFLTDVSQYGEKSAYRPGESDELLCDLRDTEGVFSLLERQLSQKQASLSGVSGFDCEWLPLAAEIARRYDLPFPSPESVRLSRDKYLTKRRWIERGVRCPRVKLIRHEGGAIQFIEELEKPLVFKPLTGAGSELTFKCDNASEVASLLHLMGKELVKRSDSPLFRPDPAAGELENGLLVLAEEFVEGPEYSADFIVDGDKTTIVRTARKIRDRSATFGTTVAYIVPSGMPPGFSVENLSQRLHEAARALDLTRAVCMADFILVKDEIVFLELTPRIGGDCLPPLVLQSCGLDTIGLALDLAEGREWIIPAPEAWRSMVGVRVLASQSGVVAGFRFDDLSTDPRVKEVYLKHPPGHTVVMPPGDYDSRVLGHFIFAPESKRCLKQQCEELRSKLIVDMEPKDDGKLTRFHNAGRRAVQSADSAA